MKIRTLRQEDTEQLLDFECRNRDWFEQHITGRDLAFYTRDGVAEHIAECLRHYAEGSFHPCLLLDQRDNIVGRANLKHIDRGTRGAEVGYRIGADSVGLGYATIALRQLKNLALDWELEQLVAYVTVKNVASARVVEKCGFQQGELIPDFALVNGAPIAVHRYLCDLRGDTAHSIVPG